MPLSTSPSLKQKIAPSAAAIANMHISHDPEVLNPKTESSSSQTGTSLATAAAHGPLDDSSPGGVPYSSTSLFLPVQQNPTSQTNKPHRYHHHSPAVSIPSGRPILLRQGPLPTHRYYSGPQGPRPTGQPHLRCYSLWSVTLSLQAWESPADRHPQSTSPLTGSATACPPLHPPPTGPTALLPSLLRPTVH
jgi:hypothetical protein